MKHVPDCICSTCIFRRELEAHPIKPVRGTIEQAKTRPTRWKQVTRVSTAKYPKRYFVAGVDGVEAHTVLRPRKSRSTRVSSKKLLHLVVGANNRVVLAYRGQS